MRKKERSRGRYRWTGAVITWLLFATACGTMTPGARLRNEIFWDAAKECESRHRTLHLDRIDPGGNLTMYADAESRQDFAPFLACYREAVRARIAQRRQAGLPMPDELNEEPTAEID